MRLKESHIEPLDDLPYWTGQRHELLRWINDRAPSFTEGYIAAVTLLHQPAFPARIHLICHIVREFYTILPAVLGADPPTQRHEVFQLVKNLVEQWDKSASIDPVSPDPVSLRQVSLSVHSSVRGLVERARKLSNQPSPGERLARALFRSIDRGTDDFIHPRVIRDFNKDYRFFVSKAHLVMHVDKIPTDEGLAERFESFERSLHALVGPYFSGKDELDAILQDTNPKPN